MYIRISGARCKIPMCVHGYVNFKQFTLTNIRYAATFVGTMYVIYTYMSERETSLPSNFQVICGVGVPIAMHLSETSGPGFNKWPMNLYLNTGLEAVGKNKLLSFLRSR